MDRPVAISMVRQLYATYQRQIVALDAHLAESQAIRAKLLQDLNAMLSWVERDHALRDQLEQSQVHLRDILHNLAEAIDYDDQGEEWKQGPTEEE